MIDDLHIHFARGCAILGGLLVVYLVACGINAGIDWVARVFQGGPDGPESGLNGTSRPTRPSLSPVRGTGVPAVSASGKDRRMAAAIGLWRKLARLCKSKTAGARGASGAGAPGACILSPASLAELRRARPQPSCGEEVTP